MQNLCDAYNAQLRELCYDQMGGTGQHFSGIGQYLNGTQLHCPSEGREMGGCQHSGWFANPFGDGEQKYTGGRIRGVVVVPIVE